MTSVLQQRWKEWTLIALLGLVTYAPTLQTGFLWDDHVMIEQNPWLRDWSPAALRHDFTTDVFDGQGDAYYRPAQTIANRFDFTLWGLRPVGFHLSNLLAHLLNAVLVMELLLAAGQTLMVGLLAGCLFAVHPIGVEQLMIIAGRAELMGLTFVLATILLFLQKRQAVWPLGYLTFLIALLFKEANVVTPVLAALIFYLAKKPRPFYTRLVPCFVLLLPYFWLRGRAVGPTLVEASPVLMAQFFVEAFPAVLLRYAWLLVLPWNLHSHRMMPHLSFGWPVLLFLLFFGLGTAIRLRHRLALFSAGWFIVTLLPKTPAMMDGNFMLDHWAYPAAIGLMTPLAVFFSKAWDLRHRRPRHALAMVLFPVLIGWSLLAHLNVALRGTDEKMYRWALHFTSSNPIKYNLGVHLLETGRPQEAVRYFEEVRYAYPNDPKNLYAMAKAYWRLGHHWLAKDILRKTIEIRPDFELARQTLKSIEKSKQ